MRSVKKLAADLAKLNQYICASKHRVLYNIPGVDALRILNYAKCELERRLSEEPKPEEPKRACQCGSLRPKNGALTEDNSKLRRQLREQSDDYLNLFGEKEGLAEKLAKVTQIANAATVEAGKSVWLKSLIAQQCVELKDLNKCQTNWLQQIVDLKAANAGLNEQVESLTRQVSVGQTRRVTGVWNQKSAGIALKRKAEQPLSPERRLAIQFAEMPPHTRLPIDEMEHGLAVLHGKRVAEYEKVSEAYVSFKCPASELKLSGALGALTDIRIRLTRFAKLREEYKAAYSASGEATLDYRKGKIALAALDDARKRLHRVVGELEALCKDAEKGSSRIPYETEAHYLRRIGFIQ